MTIRSTIAILTVFVLPLTLCVNSFAEVLEVSLRWQREREPGGGIYDSETRQESWQPSQTAVIVCDTWDLHHCFRAVGRLQQLVPRLDQVLAEARKRGVTIIHSPSDCMDAYRDHPARKRAIETPSADYVPGDVGQWCSAIPAEERAVYPIDQSDGGEDDDPEEHARWVAKLRSMGRNPATPWKQQSDRISIDPTSDYISDRGDEVWNILQHRGIDHVILTGVHTNMCVLGRPFGLRNLARNGKHVVLMRDMTDTMYNPQRWPYVSHFEGTRRVISHIERFVCPTISSNQILGGEPFRFEGDTGDEVVAVEDTTQPSRHDSFHRGDPRQRWLVTPVPQSAEGIATLRGGDDAHWYRCVVQIPGNWVDDFAVRHADAGDDVRMWCNGQEMSATDRGFRATSKMIFGDDANLLVLRIAGKRAGGLRSAPTIHSGEESWTLSGRWQYRVGSDWGFSTIPLPAKFGGSPDIVFTPQSALWTPRVVTRSGEFTAGIEGPACDRDGNIFAVNFGTQGTIGRIRPDGAGEVFVDLSDGSVGNGIRFAPDGSFFVADYTQHNVLRVDPVTRLVTVHAHQPEMSQPNDLAISPDGKTLFASDPNWSEGTGQLWRIDADGKVTRLAQGMGTTNGIEVSPDGRTLYVNESKQRNVWAFRITEDGNLADKTLLKTFDDYGFDGMRCDVDGNLYITRHGKGTVVKMSPEGRILREIPVLGSKPSNLCFGGPDRRTVYVTEVDSRRLVRFRVDRPGRE